MNAHFWFIAPLITLSLMACSTNKGGTTGGNPSETEDDSASGAAAQALGGVLSATSSGGVQAYYRPPDTPLHRPSSALIALLNPWPKAWAAGNCPTYLNTTSACSASGSTLHLTYSDCSFAGSSAVWRGRQALTMSSGTAACGTFPNPGAGGTLYRQFTNTAGTSPGSALVTSGFGTAAVIDHSSSNLSNFDGATIATLNNGGYGLRVVFNGSGARSQITLAERVAVVGAYDHTITGQLTISETSGATSRTVSGSINVYLNGVKVVGTSTFSSVGHSDMCCHPTSGTITTTFAAGANVSPTALGSLLLGKSESLTFTGCGTAQLTTYDGSVKNVRLSRCF